LAGARNSGVEASQGEFVAFCDDDDYWLPGKLERQLAVLQGAPDAGLVTCGIRVEYDGNTFQRVLDMDEVPFEELLRDRHTELHPSTFLMRRSALLEDIGLVDERVPGGFGEDYELLLRAAKQHPIVNVCDALTVVRWGRQSFFFRRWETMAAGLSWLLERYPEFERSPRGSARIHGQIAFAHASMGNRRTALTWAFRSLRRRKTEPRAFLAAAVAARVVSADRIMETLHRHGRGI
jgi:glycosyltransferase involved in cell wall biosynthesis